MELDSFFSSQQKNKIRIGGKETHAGRFCGSVFFRFAAGEFCNSPVKWKGLIPWEANRL